MRHPATMEQSAELARLIENLIRLGTIAEVQMKPPRVRVKSGNLTSNWLVWITLRAGETREWNPPTVGEQCIVFSPSGNTAAGIVLVGIPSDLIPAPSDSPDEHVRLYPDGARIAYNHATGALSATGIKTALVEAANHVTVDCPSTTCTGDVLVMGNLTVNGDTVIGGTATIMKLLSYLSGMSGKPGTGGGKTVIKGVIEHDGEFTNTGRVSSNGIVLDTHTHGDPQGGTVGEPQ